MSVKLLEFSASWCGTCKRMSTMVKRVCNSHNVELEVVNVELNKELAEQYAVDSLPTFVKVEDEVILDEKVGSMNPNEFETWLMEDV